MNEFSLISLLAFLLASTLGGYVLQRNPRETMNRVFFLFCISGAYWSFTEFGYRQAETIQMAEFWLNAGLLWLFTPAFELHFILLFTEARRAFKTNYIYLLIYGPALILSVALIIEMPTAKPIEVFWGWSYDLMANFYLSLMVSIWVVIMGTANLILTIRAFLYTRSIQRRRQILLVLTGLLLTYVIGFSTRALPAFIEIRFPELNSAGFILECLLITIAIWKYSLFALTPASAAENIIATMRDALFLVSTDGRVVTANQGAAKLLHCNSPADLVGKMASTFLAERERAIYENTWLAQLQEQGTISDVEAYFRTFDDHDLVVSLSASILRTEDGPARGIIYVVRDLTNRKEEERQKLDFEKRLHQAQKLESLGILSKGIAHDFNNLLMIILGNTDIALYNLPDDSPARKSIKTIKATAVRSTDLVRQMLTYSGKGKFVLEPVALNNVLKEQSDLLEASVSKKATLRFDLAKPLPVIEADLTQVRQIMLNLITNASEALENESGTITVSTRVEQLLESDISDMPVKTNAKAGRYVILAVEDTGKGISPDEMTKIFDPFYSTKFPGRGLGLSSVLGIIREHHGLINVGSVPEEGTRIYVGFPIVEEPEVVTMEEIPSPEEWQGSGTLLVVDDEAEVLDVAQQLLELLGFDVITAQGGREALSVYAERSQDIRCILLDLTMPEMDGIETLRELTKLDADIRVVICSGYDESDIRERFEGLSLVGVIPKPFQFAELQRRMQEYCEFL